MKCHNHAYSFGLEVISSHEGGEDVTGGDLRRAILARLATMSDDEVREACDGGAPFDSYEMSDSEVNELRQLGRRQISSKVRRSQAIAEATCNHLLALTPPKLAG
jgi:hypothetical protein